MPTYTYHCDSCGQGFETVQRFADDPLTECPQCGSRIRRVIQPVGVVFKGSGWYITDSRPKSSSDGAETDSGAKSKTKSKSDNGDGAGKSESTAKPEKDKAPAKVAD
jgi:putative FmdB family regulatory protein